MQPSFLSLSGNRRIAYHLSEGKLPCVIFMGGFKSDMQGGKAMALEAFCKARKQRFLRFDYTGHGESSGRFEDGTIGSWKQDALEVIQTLAADKNILVGSSMGAWLALLVARELGDKIRGLVTVAAAADFTERCIWQRLSENDRKKLMEEGVYHAPSCYGNDPYPITRVLVEEGRNHLLLDAPIALDIPVRMLHGMRDADVPWQTSQTILEILHSDDVELHLIKNGCHRLSEPDQLALMCHMVSGLLS